MSINPMEKAAARAGLRAINPVSIHKNIEYFFFIYRAGNRFGVTPSVTSEIQDGVAEDKINEALKAIPRGGHVTAAAHTHGREGEGAWEFSREDLQFARARHLNIYLATPNNVLVMWDPTGLDGFFPREPL
jgi:hypothetical protein